MKMKFIITAVRVLSFVGVQALSLGSAKAQTALYPEHFNLSEVTLSDSPMKTAMDLNIQNLLKYDTDRLLTPYVRQAGLTTGDYADWETLHPNFSNWGSGTFRLDGHVGGHYLSAISLAYAACKDETTRTQLKTRIDHMVSVMNDCQTVFDSDETGLYGMISGVPDNTIWTTMYSGSIPSFGYSAVPLYTEHKVFVGLRDAYIYGGNETAKKCFLKMADWFVGIFKNLTTDQQQTILNTEHGGVNEVMADAYLMAKDDADYISKAATYLEYAKKYSHTTMVDGLQTLSTTFLDNKHANTQVPKYIGFERIYQLDNTATTYNTAAHNFWQDVAQNRTVCIGGNSVNEAFLASSASNRYIDEQNGPESCNSNNMLKLSEELFDETHNAEYADFYEGTTWNHILSTQDPETGGYVYFTPLRPQSYRIYSKENQDMWCCVGTGMENHSKYGHFAYTHSKDNSTLYVNLFLASTLDNSVFGLTQATSFPYSTTSEITINKAGTYAIAVRHPSWAQEGYNVKVNGEDETGTVTVGTASYVTLSSRTWSVGDKITITLPMALRLEQCPNLTNYIAFKYGPILLGAKTSQSTDASAAHYETLTHEYAAGERMGHAPDSYLKKKAITTSPMLLCSRDDALNRVTTTDASQLTFSLNAQRTDDNAANYPWNDGNLTLAPYYSLHHARVCNYFYQATEEEYANSSLAASETYALALEGRTITAVATGEQQSEAGITSYSTDVTGTYADEHYRSAETGAGGWVQYELANPDAISANLSVILRFTTADAGRAGTIYINSTKVRDFTISSYMGYVDGSFVNYEVSIPDNLLKNDDGTVKTSLSLKVVGTTYYYPSLYYVRLLRVCGSKILSYDNGWRKMTEMPSDDDLSKYYYVIREYGTDLMVTMGRGNQDATKSWKFAQYKTLTPPTENLGTLWTIERNTTSITDATHYVSDEDASTDHYSLRNMAYPALLVQSEDKPYYYNLDLNDQTAPSGTYANYSAFDLSYDTDNDYWRIKRSINWNTAGWYWGRYVDGNTNADGEDLACNKSQDDTGYDNVGHFVIYKIEKDVLNGLMALQEVSTSSLGGWTNTSANKWNINTSQRIWAVAQPFMQDWIANGSVLNAKEIYTTLTGMTPGTYTVSINAFAFTDSNSPAKSADSFTGMEIFANSNSVDATAGLNKITGGYTNTQCVYDNYTVQTTVGEDGELKLGVRTTSDCNFNWLGFNNVRITLVSTLSSVTRTTKTSKYGTLCLPFDFEANGVTLYTINNLNGSTIEMNEVGTNGEAGIPYLYCATADSQTFSDKNTCYTAQPKLGDNGLTGTFVKAEVPVGSYILQTPKGRKQGFYKVTAEGTYSGANKCYLTISSNAREAFFFECEDIATSIETVDALLNSDARIYDLNGIQRSRLEKGINIVGGRKIIVK